MVQRTVTYREQSRAFMAQAYEEMAKGDLARASKKGWEAAEQMVKAIADERGWECASEWDVLHAVGNFHRYIPDAELDGLFCSAYLLHTNYYEFGNVYSTGFIRDVLRDVRNFIDKAEDLLLTTG